MRYVLTTSGAYGKVDGTGQGHYPEVEARLMQPVTQSCRLFFGWVAERRQMRPDAVDALEAGVLWGAPPRRRTCRHGGSTPTVSPAPRPSPPATTHSRRSPRASLWARCVRHETTTMTDSRPPWTHPLTIQCRTCCRAPPARPASTSTTIVAGPLSADLDAAGADRCSVRRTRHPDGRPSTPRKAALTEATAKVKAADSARITAGRTPCRGLLTPAERDEYPRHGAGGMRVGLTTQSSTADRQTPKAGHRQRDPRHRQA